MTAPLSIGKRRMKSTIISTISAVLLASGIAEAGTWNGRWRGRADPPSGADVIIRINRLRPVFFSWGGGRIGTLNAYVESSPQKFRFATNGGADITLTPNGPGSIRFRYWSQYYGDAAGVLVRTPCKNIGPANRCLDP